MVLSQNNYGQVLSKELLKQAGKNRVRECDEIGKGHFQAYVDENENSFDVSLHLNKDGEVIEHRCDCNSRIVFCRHKAALLLSLEKSEENSGRKIKKNKKVSPFESLLEEIDTDQLKEWIRNQLGKNKELELAFLHQFSDQKKIYKPANIRQLTLDAVKAVAGKRKKLETGEVRKIIELWTETHKPIIVKYHADVSNKESFLNFYAITESCNEVATSLNAPGRKFNKYIAGVLLNTAAVLQGLQDENAWNTATGYYTECINDIHFELREHYLVFLTHLHEVDSKERKEKLTHKLVAQFAKNKPKQLHKDDIYTEIVFNLVKKTELFDKYYKLFKPIRYQNEYNQDLIHLLIEHGQLDFAEKFCLDQIQGNNRQEYSLSYLSLLKEIFTIRKDSQKLVEVLKVLVPQTFDFTDFRIVYDQLEGDEKKKWRTKILTRAGHMGAYNTDANSFSFKLMDHEQNYKKMIDYIGSHTPYSIIVQYADKMARANKDGFIRQLFNKSDYSRLYHQGEDYVQDELMEELLRTLQKNYTVRELKLIVREFEKSAFYYRNNVFMDFVKKMLI